MNYSPEDYVQFYNDQVRTVNARHGWRFVGALLLVVVLGIWLSGCDGEAAQVTAQIEQEAHQQKQALMGMPCTWVAQCMRVELPCDVKQRKCVRAE